MPPIRYAIWHVITLAWGVLVLADQMGTSQEAGWLRKAFGQPDGRWYVRLSS